jgi:hypothetical protein
MQRLVRPHLDFILFSGVFMQKAAEPTSKVERIWEEIGNRKRQNLINNQDTKTGFLQHTF